MSMKNPLTPAGIEPATFRFVAQHLSHCATAVPFLDMYCTDFIDTHALFVSTAYKIQNSVQYCRGVRFNPLNAELNPICHLLALLGAHHIFDVSRLSVKMKFFSS